MVASRPSRSEEKSEPSSEFTGSLGGNLIYLWSMAKLVYVCRYVDERAQNKYLCKRATSYMERPREKISALGNCGPATPPILRAQFQCSSSVKYNIFQLRTLSPSATLLHELRRHVATISLLPTCLLLAPSHHMTKVAYLVPGQDMFSVHPLIGISDELSQA